MPCSTGSPRCERYAPTLATNRPLTTDTTGGEHHRAHNTGSGTKIHNFGRADAVDRAALARLVASISRFLDPEQAIAAAHAGQVDVLDSRRFGGAWVLDQLWDRLGIGAALRQVAAGRRVDGGATERVLFALVAQRALEPGSKLAATGWVADRVAIADCAGFSDDCAYAAMDFLLDALDEIAGRIFDIGRAPAQPGRRHRLRRFSG